MVSTASGFTDENGIRCRGYPLSAHRYWDLTKCVLLHVKTIDGLDKGLAVRMATFTAVMVLSTLLIKQWTNWLQMPPVQPWGE